MRFTEVPPWKKLYGRHTFFSDINKDICIISRNYPYLIRDYMREYRSR